MLKDICWAGRKNFLILGLVSFISVGGISVASSAVNEKIGFALVDGASLIHPTGYGLVPSVSVGTHTGTRKMGAALFTEQINQNQV